MAWSDKFSHPIKWGQRNLNTLQDAQIFIERLSTSPGPVPAWREAHELLKQAAEHGGLWCDLARIEMMHVLLDSRPHRN
jgi:hypothetical protein